MNTRPLISVVISTYNRAASLQDTLDGLRRQTYTAFEVVVVDGPSTDATPQVLAALDDVRALSCPVTNLSRSRNTGIAAAAGEVVAFIDDDAIPESGWLSGLAGAYADPAVAGAGGPVFDHTGVELQYRYSVCDRAGRGRFDVHRPLDRFVTPGADPFLYLQGTNMSFRRSALVELGGFDDDIEYMYDEVEVCLRLVDRGGRLVMVEDAAVHHRYLPSHLRNRSRINIRPFLPMRNRAYFALQYGRGSRSTLEIVRGLLEHAGRLKVDAEQARARGELTAEEAAVLVQQVDAGLEAGIRRGLDGTRVVTSLPQPDPAGFRPFRTPAPEGGRLSVVLLCGARPAAAWRTAATGLARRGHEVHVLEASEGPARVDVEEGVWVHRTVHREPVLPDLARHPVAAPLSEAAELYAEVAALHRRDGVDAVIGAAGGGEAAVCALDGRFATVLGAGPGGRSGPLPEAAVRGSRGRALLEDAAGARAERIAAPEGDRGVDELVVELRRLHTRAGAPGVEAMPGEMAALVVELTGISAAGAVRAARRLLGVDGEAGQLLRGLRHFWAKPPPAFVEGVLTLLTGESDPGAVEAALERLEAGATREALVRELAGSAAGHAHLGGLSSLDGFDRMLEEVRIARLQALWPAPADTFVAGVFDLVAERPATRWEWLTAVGGLAAGHSRAQVLRAVDRVAGGAERPWLAVVEARVATAEASAAAAALRSALSAPDAGFVDAVYGVLLRRDPEPPGRAGMLARLAGGTPRGVLIHDAALSDEVVDRALDTGFLLGVPGPAPPPAQRWKGAVGLAGGRLDAGLGGLRRRAGRRGALTAGGG